MHTNISPLINPSQIGWPEWLVAQKDMAYESIAILYDQESPAPANDNKAIRNTGFVVSCSKARFYSHSGCQGSLHKLEAETEVGSSFAQARLNVTHEVIPGKRSCAQIIPVKPNKLLAACFDEPCVIPIKNFGYKKTFNCDVRAGISTGTHSLTCLATDGCGHQIAAGSMDGYVTLFDVREEISLLARSQVADLAVKVVGLEYIQDSASTHLKPSADKSGLNAIVFATQAGCIGTLDPRVNTGDEIKSQLFMRTEPRLNLSSLCVTSLFQGNSVFFGSSHGHLVGIDLRNSKSYTHELKFPDDRAIARMRQVNFQDPYSDQKKSCLVYTNGSNQLKCLDLESMEQRNDFVCDRNSDGQINDFVQLNDRIVTCGDRCSIGCWLMPKKPQIN